MATPQQLHQYHLSAKFELLEAFIALREAREFVAGERVCAVGQRIFGREQWERCFPMLTEFPPPGVDEAARQQRLREALLHLVECYRLLHFAERDHAAGIIDNLARGLFGGERWSRALH